MYTGLVPRLSDWSIDKGLSWVILAGNPNKKISRIYCLEDWKKSPGKEDCLRRGAQSLDLRFLEQKSAQVSFLEMSQM